MKITKRQLRRIIKEEKAILSEYGPIELPPRIGNPGKALTIIHTGIDQLIEDLGNENAYLELAGILEDWDHE